MPKSPPTAKWLNPFWTAFGENGFATLAFWTMCRFGEQIRREQKSLGFLELSGQQGTGKSTLLHFLAKLDGSEDYQAFNPGRATKAAYCRTLASIANRPIVFMDTDRFDWDEIKSLFNGRIGRASGTKTGDNGTDEPIFRGGLIIEQSAPFDASPAVLTRTLQLDFTKDRWTEATRQAAAELDNWQVSDFAEVASQRIDREASYLKTFRNAYAVHLNWLKKAGVENSRLCHIHAQLQAGVAALVEMFDIPAWMLERAHGHVDSMAIKRDIAERSLPSPPHSWGGVGAKSPTEGSPSASRTKPVIDYAFYVWLGIVCGFVGGILSAIVRLLIGGALK